MGFLVRVLANAVAILVAAAVVPGIEVSGALSVSWGTAAVTSVPGAKTDTGLYASYPLCR